MGSWFLSFLRDLDTDKDESACKHGVRTAASFQCPKPARFACFDSTPSSCAHVLAVFPLMEFDRYPLWGEFDSAVWVDLNFHSQQ